MKVVTLDLLDGIRLVLANATGQIGNAVLLLRHQLYVYYGGADKVVGVASIDVDLLVEGLVREAKFGGN